MQAYATKLLIYAVVLAGVFCFGLYVMGRYKDAKIEVLEMKLEAVTSAYESQQEAMKKERDTCDLRLKAKDNALKNVRRTDALKQKVDDQGNITPDDPILLELNGMFPATR